MSLLGEMFSMSKVFDISRRVAILGFAEGNAGCTSYAWLDTRNKRIAEP